MDTETVRLNVTLPKGLVEAMNRMTGPRKRSWFMFILTGAMAGC